MSDNSTAVKCPKCGEWVSGAHHCGDDFPCGKCDNGWIYGEHIDMLDPPPQSKEKCPSCNKGRVHLAVECGTCKGSGVTCTFHNGPIYDHIEEGCECEYSQFAASMKLHRIDKCENEETCPECTNGYRPLTDSEVRELVNSLKPTGTTQYDPVELLMSNIERGKQKFKGQQVVLIPTTN